MICKEKPSSENDGSSNLRQADDDVTDKLGTCSEHTDPEIEQLDCEFQILHAGDALFLPRHELHSARALSDSLFCPFDFWLQ